MSTSISTSTSASEKMDIDERDKKDKKEEEPAGAGGGGGLDDTEVTGTVKLSSADHKTFDVEKKYALVSILVKQTLDQGTH